jgi:hypothetical protein
LTEALRYGSLRLENWRADNPLEANIPVKPLIVVLGIAVLPLLAAPHAMAQTTVVQPSPSAAPAPRHARPRIVITPRPLAYRRCVDRYELQYRPSGTVLFPQKHCWWVRG